MGAGPISHGSLIGENRAHRFSPHTPNPQFKLQICCGHGVVTAFAKTLNNTACIQGDAELAVPVMHLQCVMDPLAAEQGGRRRSPYSVDTMQAVRQRTPQPQVQPAGAARQATRLSGPATGEVRLRPLRRPQSGRTSGSSLLLFCTIGRWGVAPTGNPEVVYRRCLSVRGWVG